MRRPKSKPHTQASRPPVVAIEMPVRSVPTETNPTTHKRELSEADRLIQDLVESHLPDPNIDDNEDSQSDNTTPTDDIVDDSSGTPSVDDLVNQAISGVPFPDEIPPEKAHALEGTDGMSPKTGSQVTQSSTTTIDDIVDDSSATPSINDLMNQAIAEVPFPDEIPPEKAHALEGTDAMSPKTGSQAEAFVDGVISNITDDNDGTKQIPADPGILGDTTLGMRAQTLLEQVVSASVQDLDTYDT